MLVSAEDVQLLEVRAHLKHVQNLSPYASTVVIALPAAALPTTKQKRVQESLKSMQESLQASQASQEASLRQGFESGFERLRLDITASSGNMPENVHELIKERDAAIKERDATIKERDDQIKGLSAEVSRLKAELLQATGGIGGEGAAASAAAPESIAEPTNLKEALEGIKEIEDLLDAADGSVSVSGNVITCAKVVLKLVQAIPGVGTIAGPLVEALG